MYTFYQDYAVVYTTQKSTGIPMLTVVCKELANELIDSLNGDFYGVGTLDDPQQIFDPYYCNYTKYKTEFITNVKPI